jgi:hypothetical protein
MPSLRMLPLGPFPGSSMLPHHWCADSCAVTRNATFVFGSLFVRKPMLSENVMFVGNPCA